MSTTSPTSNFAMPTSCLANVISFLPSNQLLSIRVNKLWQAASHQPICQITLIQSILRLPNWERTPFLSNCPQLIDAVVEHKFHELLDPNSEITSKFLSEIVQFKFNESFSEGMNFLKSLSQEKLELITSFSSNSETDDQLTQIIELLPNLKSLHLEGSCITGQVFTQISANNQLENLNLSYCFDLNEEFLKIFSPNATHLRKVDLSRTGITGEWLADLPPGNHLEKLILRECGNLNEEFLISFSERATHLTKIDLSKTNTTGEALSCLPDNNQLETLYLTGCQDLEEAFLKRFFSTADQLQEAILARGPTTGEGLSFIPINNQLKILDLSGCQNLEEGFLKDFFEKAFQLKQVNLSGTNTTGEGLSHILVDNQLKILYLTNCNNLDEESLGSFFSKAAQLKQVDLSNSKTRGKGLSCLPEDNQLESLIIYKSLPLAPVYFSEEFYKIFFSKATRLKKIDFYRLRITGESLSYLPGNNQLESLTLKDCPDLNEEFLERFFSKAGQLKWVTIL